MLSRLELLRKTGEHQFEEQQEYQTQLLNFLLTGDFSILHFIDIKTELSLLNLFNVNLMFVSKQTSVIFIAYAKGHSHSSTCHHQHLDILEGVLLSFLFPPPKSVLSYLC